MTKNGAQVTIIEFMVFIRLLPKYASAQSPGIGRARMKRVLCKCLLFVPDGLCRRFMAVDTL